MAFGVFDHFHKGHEYFLSEAKSRCDELVVVVTVPGIVELLKKRQPDHSLEERKAHIATFDASLSIVSGDEALGSWQVLRMHEPDIVFLGYDQQGIARELDKLGQAYALIGPHHPERYKSSIVGKQARLDDLPKA